MLFSRRTQIIQPFTGDFHDAVPPRFSIRFPQRELVPKCTLINESLIAAADYVKQQARERTPRDFDRHR